MFTSEIDTRPKHELAESNGARLARVRGIF